ncbi:hypothetical protein Tco_0741210, partial [Tanacetum coccineum]
KVEKGHYEDLIETWRKGHSSKKTGEFKTEQNKQRYLDMKVMQEMIKVGIIPFKTDQEIQDEVVPSDNRQNMSGMGRKQQEQEKELYRKQAEEAQAHAYLASLKADAADQRANVTYQNTESIYGALVICLLYSIVDLPSSGFVKLPLIRSKRRLAGWDGMGSPKSGWSRNHNPFPKWFPSKNKTSSWEN